MHACMHTIPVSEVAAERQRLSLVTTFCPGLRGRL